MNEPVSDGLYLCVMRITLDHTVIEVGIALTLKAAVSTDGAFKDSQIEAALEYLALFQNTQSRAPKRGFEIHHLVQSFYIAKFR